MYKIKNITNGKLILGDIGINLKAGETRDLDACMPREKADASVNLRVAEDNELIAVLHKDVVHATTALSIDPTVFLEMERRIRDQIVQQMPHQAPAPVAPQMMPAQIVYTPQTSQTTEVAQLTAKLSELISKMGNQSQSAQHSPVQDVLEYTPDTDKLQEVHAKALKRMTKGASGHVEASEKVSDSNVADRASELDDLLK